MKKTFIALLIAAATAGACADDASSSGTPPASSTAISDEVTLEAIAFEPARLTIEAGTTVTWTNEDEGVAHTVTSGKPKKQGIPGISEDTEGKPDGVFNAELAEAGDTYEFTFDERGTYRYFCAIHAPMTGTIIVE